MPLDTKWFKFTVSIQAQSVSLATDGQWNVPTFGTAVTGVKCDLPPAGENLVRNIGGDFSREHRILITQAGVAYNIEDKITVTGSPGNTLNGTVWMVAQPPVDYPDPRDGTIFHREVVVVRAQ